ncbi:hypothetical protein TrVE_jg13742 [Triparma verrucosa]|uniref:NAD(P)-binding domain-containing protein n=1 Tax=Triparma verrucosa TaxID=1606542 RepID=A0A9W7CEU8_9STRA|nr:hypothetical protein TrVE_jg13742 [Triparma verrucosa]
MKLTLNTCVLLIIVSLCDGFSFRQPSARPSSPLSAQRIVVTGAGGKTGQLVFEQLQADSDFTPVGVVRSEKKAKLLRAKFNANEDQVIIGDICSSDEKEIAGWMTDADALVVATSAVPVLKKRSLVKMLAKKLTFQNVGKPEFKWSAPDGFPENVDYKGQLKQFDAAVSAGVKRIVVCSSMGGTQEDNFLNSIGKQEDGSGGDILKWKRKAEQYLVGLKSVSHSIVHPGGLTNKPVPSRKLVVDVNDALLARKKRQIYRGDVAAVMVDQLRKTENAVFDIVSEEVEGGEEGFDMAAMELFEKQAEKQYVY